MSELLERLREPFPVAAVRQRSQGGTTLDYIDIAETIGRVLDVTEGSYTTEVVSSSCTPMDGQYFALVTMRVTVGDDFHDGVGAMVNRDPDMAIKTALAEAFKKAMHYWGVGLELWSADHRETLALQRAAVAGDVTALKTLVFRQVRDAGADTSSAQAIADFYGVAPADLDDVEALTRLALGA